MPDPTNPPTPAEIAEIIAAIKEHPDEYCACPGTTCGARVHCESMKALVACAERGIAPPSGEVEWALGYLDSIAIRVHDIENEREKAFDILRRLSSPPVAAPSGEAAPKPHTAKFTGEYYRALADGSKGVDSETFEDALNHAAYLADSFRTLSDGKAAAEARAERLRDHYECKMSGAERGTRLEAWATDAERGRAASESRCAALERALDEAEAHIRNVLSAWRYEAMQGDGIHEDNSHVYDAAYAFVNRGRQIISVSPAALASAEPAKPIMPECVRALREESEIARDELARLQAVVSEIDFQIMTPIIHRLDLAISAVEAAYYYAKPSATAGEEK